MRRVLREFPADIIVGDDMMSASSRCYWARARNDRRSFSAAPRILHWRRDDGAPLFLGLPPAGSERSATNMQRSRADYDRIVNQPIALRPEQDPEELDVGPLSTVMFESVVNSPIAYIQLSVPCS